MKRVMQHLRRITEISLIGILLFLMGVICYAEGAENGCSQQEGNPLDCFPYQNVDYSHEGKLSSQFVYNDGMMLTDANELSEDIAKVSVGLAVVAYGKGEEDIGELLKGKMGYNPANGKEFEYNYGKKSTYEDNDFVAYAIGHKEIPYEDTIYHAYIVPIRGTLENCEWFSNFNLGSRSDGYHEGFKKAADEVLQSIARVVKTDNNIFLVTGHSRGAAVANIVAGELSLNPKYSALASRDHIFGYTFACPAVRLHADTSLTNIRNYNNTGDAIAEVPLKEWGYRRYGISIDLARDKRGLANFRRRFQSVMDTEYQGTANTISFVSTLKSLADTKEAFDSRTNQLLFDFIACGLGERSIENFTKIAVHHGLNIVQEASFLTIARRLIAGNMGGVVEDIQQDSAEFAKSLNQALEDTEEMSSEEFSVWLDRNQTLVKKIETELEVTVETRLDIVASLNLLSSSNIVDFSKGIINVCYLFYDTKGHPLHAITDAHTQETYVLWINSMYYGYAGWSGNNEVLKIRIAGVHNSSVDADCFRGCKKIDEIVIEDTVRQLGKRAFSNCVGVRKVTLPVDIAYGSSAFSYTENVEEIHYTRGFTGVMLDRTQDGEDCYAWKLENRCSGVLRKVIFDKGITHIGDWAFAYGSLEEVALPVTLKSVGSCAFCYQRSMKVTVAPEGLEELGACSFTRCVGLTDLAEVGFPGSVEEVPESCFEGCTGLTELEIPETVKQLGADAFMWCTGFTELEIPETVKQLGARTFFGCTGVRKVTLPVDIAYVSNCYNATFYDTGNVEEIHYTRGATGVMPDRMEDGENSCYYTLEGNSSEVLRRAVFDEGITHIGDYVFYRGNGLEEVSLPGTLKSVGKYAFYDEPSLEVITMPEGLEELGAYSFTGCVGLTDLAEVGFPGSVEEVPEGCFEGCTGLVELKIPGTVKQLGKQAFRGCTEVRKVTLPVDIVYVCNDGAYYEPTFAEIHNVEEIHYTRGSTGVMLDRTEEGSGENDCYYPYTLEGQSLEKLKKAVFDEGIIHIGDYAFYARYSLEEVALPKTLKSVGKYAFYDNTSLKSIVMPEGLEKLGEYSFAGCQSLTGLGEIGFPGNVEEVPEGCFSRCYGFKELEIPKTVKQLDAYAFGSCTKVKKVTLPVDIVYVGNDNDSSTFYFTKNVEEIHYTRGATGVMPDRTTGDDSKGEYYYQYTLEGWPDNLKKIVFDEGITHIGNYAFCTTPDLADVLLPSTIEQIGIGNFSWISPENITFYGTAGTLAESYADGLHVAFIPLNLPQISIESEAGDLEPGKIYPCTAKVYTGINEFLTAVTWSINGASSGDTYIEESGLLHIAENETAEELTIFAAYGESVSDKTVQITVHEQPAYQAEFTGAITTTMTADQNNQIYRPIDLEIPGSSYTYYLIQGEAKQQIQENEWPLTISESVVIEVQTQSEGNIYQIIYHLDGGENHPDNPTTYIADATLLTIKDPSKPHFTFDGWYTDASYGNPFIFESAYEGNLDLYAHWIPLQYTISFQENGGMPLENTEQQKTLDALTPIGSLPDCVREGYTLDGWFSEEGAQATPETLCQGNMLLSARWTANNYQLTYDGNGGIVPEHPLQSVTFGQPYGLLELTYREGYLFRGWYTEKDGGTLVEPETIVSIAADHTLYAHWEEGSTSHTHKYERIVMQQPTCTKPGNAVNTCTECKDFYQEEIPALGHKNKKYVTKANLRRNGSVTAKCTRCGVVSSTTVIAYPKAIILSKASFAYTGKVQKPKVTVKGSDGKKISVSNYTVKYPSGCKKVGKYKLKVTFKNNYTGSVIKTYTILPKGTKLTKLSPASKGFQVKWNKQAGQINGYEIRYSTSKNMAKSKVVAVSKYKISTVIKKLKTRKKYYVQIRTYQNVSGNKYCSDWSAAKNITTKK